MTGYIEILSIKLQRLAIMIEVAACSSLVISEMWQSKTEVCTC